MLEFRNAQEAFEYFYQYILDYGKYSRVGTKKLHNVGFLIRNPLDNLILTPYRKWSHKYAEIEWQWYLSGSKKSAPVAQYAKIWEKITDTNGEVESNYGYHWNRGNNISQLYYVINELKQNPDSRRAVISIYDGKETEKYKLDTPCTLSITFYIDRDSYGDEKLCMSVHMRSNDLVYGFCNDQYCFSKLQQLVATNLGLEVGTYYHSVVDLHIYERHYELKKETKK